MIYLLLAASLVLNGVLFWYIRKLLSKYWYDVEARDSFKNMLLQYTDTLEKLTKIEELYGEESIKTALEETNFVIEACREFKEILQKETIEEAEGAEDATEEQKRNNKGPIFLREGQSVSQDASNYRRVIPESR